VPAEAIVQRIVLLRGQKVLLDADLARLYGVQTRALVQAVKRNPNRFPEDVMFTLSNQELAVLRSQSVISNAGHGGRRSAPCAFTEQGVAMLLSVLNSPQAVRVNVAIMRAFVKMREVLGSNAQLAAKFEELARKVETHDQAIAGSIETIRELMAPEPVSRERPIGFSQVDNSALRLTG
jgi:hypothetical protein